VSDYRGRSELLAEGDIERLLEKAPDDLQAE